MTRKRLGDLLLEFGLVTKDQLDQALAEQKVTGQPLGEVLIQRGAISEDQLIEVMEFQLGVPHVNLEQYEVDRSIVDLVPEELARRYKVLPVKRRGNRLTLAMIDPMDYYAIDDIQMTTGLQIDPVIATRDSIQKAFTHYYSLKKSISEVLEDIHPEEIDESQVRGEDAPIVRMVNQLIEDAVDKRASDIHFDSQRAGVVVRFRIDGILMNQMRLPKHMQPVLTARIKIMANLNIAERRLPQDGRIQLQVRGRTVDVRVATLPTIFGEKIVLRLLDMKNAITRIDRLGFSEINEKTFMRMVNSAHGIVLVTGPTGSGKTSTLYAALHHLNTERQNLITIEDPVEYQLDGINQVQVNPAIGLTFAAGLRSILREDPNIIMIGEIRDMETAEIAFRAALTGHLVLSTLHTNDAASAVTRLLDMGLESYLIASTMRGVVAQRLVRRICTDCKVSYVPHAEEAAVLEKHGVHADKLWRGSGCALCNRTGYRGRLAIQEVLPFDEELRTLVTQHHPIDTYRNWARKQGFRTMLEDGLDKAVQGLTTMEEVFQVVISDE
ncbi:GspE/PulE family protein [Effusibacillus lacus]|uniref:Type II secretion system protein E n=1 Tax=Effusibacillus lacus TaxID=1348429 RepID=A0A292YBV3_9BACL|nr:ATPase, T2SS/T4P/T4SS family [Effusibacillus lacus]TCS74621.1 type IV pilus assembly protein PilB [Effusibacillus lacus]GAX88492.1 type II secretion system protein E [Effusibacillus lacus]